MVNVIVKVEGATRPLPHAPRMAPLYIRGNSYLIPAIQPYAIHLWGYLHHIALPLDSEQYSL